MKLSKTLQPLEPPKSQSYGWGEIARSVSSARTSL
jgi:hypothetical protein